MTSYLGQNFAHVGEGHYISGPKGAFWPKLKQVPIILYGHGFGGTPNAIAQHSPDVEIIRQLSKKYVVLVSDWGGNLWGNQTSVNRVTEGLTALNALNVAFEKPVGLFGPSMGTATMLNWARQNPDLVAFVACVTPLVDLADLRDNNRAGLAYSVNAAYGGSYNDLTHGPSYSPIKYASSLPENLPIHFWCGANDSITPNATSFAFVEERPQTEIDVIDVGVEGHDAGVYVAALGPLIEFCMDNSPV